MIKRSKPYRILALTLAFLVAVSSMAFAVDLHYCQGQLKSFSLVGKAKKCHEQNKQTVFCPHHNKWMVMDDGCADDADGCCKNQIALVESDQDYQFQLVDFAGLDNVLQFVAVFIQIYMWNGEQISDRGLAALDYQSPQITWDFSARYAVFIL